MFFFDIKKKSQIQSPLMNFFNPSLYHIYKYYFGHHEDMLIKFTCKNRTRDKRICNHSTMPMVKSDNRRISLLVSNKKLPYIITKHVYGFLATLTKEEIKYNQSMNSKKKKKKKKKRSLRWKSHNKDGKLRLLSLIILNNSFIPS